MTYKKPSVSFQFTALLLVVLALNSAVFYFMLQSVYLSELRSQAQTVVANVEAFGSWVAKNGRVWVKDNSISYLGEMVVNPVDAPGETVHFYSKNPALAQREFSETVAASDSPAKFRMTSQNVMNPANAPDPFEKRALDAIRQGQLGDYAETLDNNYRYAKPVYHTASCIACHGDAALAPKDVLSRYGNKNGFGFAEGDVAGIISVTIPKRRLLGGSVSVFGAAELGAIVLSILLILWFIRRSIINPVRELTRVAELISRGQPAELNTTQINAASGNEIDQLKLATSRMNTSFALAMRKTHEARKKAQQAIRVAKVLKAQVDKKDDL